MIEKINKNKLFIYLMKSKLSVSIHIILYYLSFNFLKYFLNLGENKYLNIITKTRLIYIYI